MILFLIDLMVLLILFGTASYLISRVKKERAREKALKAWKTKKIDLKKITIEQMISDSEQLIYILKNKIPQPAFNSLSHIVAYVKTLNSQPDSFSQWKTQYSQENADLLDILYKHIPESLNRYFSIPDNLTNKQTHRNGKNANDLLNETFHIFEQRVNAITQDKVSDNLNHLKTYQTFIKSKFNEQEIEKE